MYLYKICSAELLHYNCDLYEESVHADLIEEIQEFKAAVHSIHPRNPFKIDTKPLQLVHFMYLMQQPEHAITGVTCKLIRAIRAVTLFIAKRNGQLCGDILTNPKVWLLKIFIL